MNSRRSFLGQLFGAVAGSAVMAIGVKIKETEASSIIEYGKEKPYHKWITTILPPVKVTKQPVKDNPVKMDWVPGVEDPAKDWEYFPNPYHTLEFHEVASHSPPAAWDYKKAFEALEKAIATVKKKQEDLICKSIVEKWEKEFFEKGVVGGTEFWTDVKKEAKSQIANTCITGTAGVANTAISYFGHSIPYPSYNTCIVDKRILIRNSGF